MRSNAKEQEMLLETALAFDTKKVATNLGEWLRHNFFLGLQTLSISTIYLASLGWQYPWIQRSGELP